MTSQDTMQNAD